MSQSLASILVHLVFSTKNRTQMIKPEILKDLHAYIVGIAQSHESTVYEIGGVEDHVHLLISLPRTVTLSKLVEEIKKSSSKWVKTKGVLYQEFAWQRGYGAFSIGQSSTLALKNYIQNQEKHHKKISFQDEFRSLLRKYQIAFDERYVWD